MLFDGGILSISSLCNPHKGWYKRTLVKFVASPAEHPPNPHQQGSRLWWQRHCKDTPYQAAKGESLERESEFHSVHEFHIVLEYVPLVISTEFHDIANVLLDGVKIILLIRYINII